MIIKSDCTMNPSKTLLSRLVDCRLWWPRRQKSAVHPQRSVSRHGCSNGYSSTRFAEQRRPSAVHGATRIAALAAAVSLVGAGVLPDLAGRVGLAHLPVLRHLSGISMAVAADTADPTKATGPTDDASRMAAAQRAYEAGQDSQALELWLELQRSSPNFAITQDVDYWLVLSGLRAGQWMLAWEASQRWIAAQPLSVRQPSQPAEGASGSVNWASRREMLGQVGLAQVQAAYELALSSLDLAEQVQWLTRAESTAEEIERWQLEPRFAQVLTYHRNVIALQQELRRRDADQPTRLQALQQRFRSAADTATTAELREKQSYYAAVTAELFGDLETATKIWTQLGDDAQVSGEIRHASRFALAEALVNRWLTTTNTNTTVDSAVTAEVRQSHLLTARDLYLRLQKDAPDYRTATVAFNLGTCYRLLEDPASAITQFEKIAWPTTPADSTATTLAAAEADAWALAWSAQFNVARSLFDLQQWDAAVGVMDQVLPRLTLTDATSGGRAVLLRMQLAEKLGQWTQLLALAQDGAAWLQQVPQQQAEVEFLTALARFQSTDAAVRSAGVAALQSVALTPQHPFADRARLQLLPWQLGAGQVETAGQTRQDLNLSLNAETRERLEQALATATELLNGRELQIDTFPTNPALWQPEQIQVAARRKQVRESQADAWFKLGRDTEANRAYADLQRDFPQDASVGQWTIKRAIASARANDPAAALALLSEATLATWSTADQADAWWIVGQLQQMQADPVASARAYEAAWERYVTGPEKPLALDAALAAYQQAEKYQEMLRLIDRALPEANGSDAIPLLLQRGVAQFFSREHAAAEASFQQVETRVGQLPHGSPAEQQQRDEWLADARVNRGLALKELGRSADAKTVWESFLRQSPGHAHGETVGQWLRGLDPNWTAPAVANSNPSDPTGDRADVRETSGSENLSTAELRTIAEQAFAAKRWSEASQALERLAAQSPRPADHDRILYLWGWTLREQQQAAAAIATWEQLLREHLQSEWIGRSQFHLGEAAYQATDYGRAKERFQLARTAATETALQRSALYMEAWSELKQGQGAQARRLFQTLLEAAGTTDREQPLVLEAQALLAQCDFQAGDMAAAVTAYEAASSAVDKLRTLKPELAFQSCLNAGRAAIETSQPGTAILWLNRGQALIDSGNLPAEVDERTRAEVPFLLGVALRLNNQADAAQQALSQVSGRADTVGLRALFELAQVARAQGDETAARRHYQAIANGAYGDQLPPAAVELKAQALLEVGLSFVRTANQQTDTAVRAEHLRQAKTWLTRAQLQSDSATVSQQAERQLAQLGT